MGEKKEIDKSGGCRLISSSVDCSFVFNLFNQSRVAREREKWNG